MDRFKYDLFLSYDYKDKPAVRQLAEKLRRDGLRVWFDEWVIQPGEDPFWALEDGLGTSRVLVLVLSPNALGSHLVEFIRNTVFFSNSRNLSKRFIPLLLEDCKIPAEIKQYKHIDYRDASDSAYQQLLEACHPAPPPVLSVNVAHLPVGSTTLVGRRVHLDNLKAYQTDPNVDIVSFIAAGGVGKSALIEAWLTEIGPEYGGAIKVFGWSFYSQGMHATQTDSGPFFSAALPFFGHVGDWPTTDEGKASLLGELLQQQPSLLILDGVEPLQHPPEVQGGNFADVGIYRLLRFLGSNGFGTHGQNSLVVITSRQPINELESKKRGRYRETLLEKLTELDGIQLLQSLGVGRGVPSEYDETVREMKGHALGLVLLGKLLVSRYEGDIARRDQIGSLFDEKEDGRHAKHVMAHYDDVVWVNKESHRAFLRLLGLFDRPMEEAVSAVLREDAAIAKSLKGLAVPHFNAMLTDLKESGLLQEEGNAPNRRWDTHPLVREYFGNKLQTENLDGYRQAHGVLFEYFQKLPKEDLPNTLEKLEPLYRAVHHGCRAGEYQKALTDVYRKRIVRGDGWFNTSQLGAFSSNLAALAGFFPQGWASPPVKTGLSEGDRTWLLGTTAFSLMSLGRMAEAIGPRQEATRMLEKMEAWNEASQSASVLCSLQFATGELRQALDTAKKGAGWAERSCDQFVQTRLQFRLATAYHCLGSLPESWVTFQEAEKMLAARLLNYPRPYGLYGKNYCDLLLEQARKTAEWKDITQRAEYSLRIVTRINDLLAIALDYLTQGRALAAMGWSDKAYEQFCLAVDTIRKSGFVLYTPEVLLHRATFLRSQGAKEACPARPGGGIGNSCALRNVSL